MVRVSVVVRTFSITTIALAASLAFAQNYPNRPIRILAIGPGGGSDFPARLIAPALGASLNEPVIVDNRGGIIPAEIVSRATPDGYTLLVGGSTTWIGPLLQKLPYDPVKDFAGVCVINQSPNILVVHPSVSVNSVKELIALAKAHPGALNYGSGGTGSTPHLAAELFKSMAGVNIVRIPYKSGAAAFVDMIGGHTQVGFPSAGDMGPYIKSDKLKALAVASANPSALFPGLPTVAASGLPGFESLSYNGLFAPANTSRTIITRLNREVVRIINTPDVKEKFLAVGVEPRTSSPQEFDAIVRSEMSRAAKLIEDTGIRADYERSK
jgi:tripartite-type tricarboxylate transporter receptor subunit TctC